MASSCACSIEIRATKHFRYALAWGSHSGLFGAKSLEDVNLCMEQLDRTGLAPFRLLACDGHEIIECISEDEGLIIARHTVNKPFMRTSSGLGDHLVEDVRRTLFKRMVDNAATADHQDAFHHHQWPQLKHLSVRMERPEAETVSQTTIELTADNVSMRYRSVNGGTYSQSHSLQLTLHHRNAGSIMHG